MIADKLRTFLEAGRVQYHVYEHEPRFTAQEIAGATHISGKHFAKTVLVRADDGEKATLLLAVLPGHERIDFARLGRQIGHPVALVGEEVFQRVFPEFEPGAAPPIRELASEPLSMIVVDAALARQDLIAFNAGTHTAVVEMPWVEFARLTSPKIVDYGEVVPSPPVEQHAGL